MRFKTLHETLDQTILGVVQLVRTLHEVPHEMKFTEYFTDISNELWPCCIQIGI